jgi:hypothetical protein
MKSTKLLLVLFLSALLFVATSPSRAEQVVTPATRQWAKRALEEEKTLQGPSGRKTVGVLYFQNRTGQSGLDPLQKGLALMLTTDLSAVKDIEVVERIKLQALAEEMGLGTSGLVDPGTAPRVGKLLGAHWLVGGDIQKSPSSALEVISNLLDVPAQKSIGRPTAQGDLSTLFRIEKDLLFDLIRLLEIQLTSEQDAKLRRPCSTSTEALFSLFKGIDASDRGEYETAGRFYEKALREDPDICLAPDALNELQKLGRIVGRKKSREMLNTLRGETSLTNQLTPKEPIRRELTPKDLSPGPCLDCRPAPGR